MVSEESFNFVGDASSHQKNRSTSDDTSDKSWLSEISASDNSTSENVRTACSDLSATTTDGDSAIEDAVKAVLENICDQVVCSVQSEVMTRGRKIIVDERCMKKANRRTSIIENEVFAPSSDFLEDFSKSSGQQLGNHGPVGNQNDRLRVHEAINPVIEAVVNNKPRDKPKKKLSFRLLFPKKNKVKEEQQRPESCHLLEHPETYDDFDPDQDVTIRRMKKYASAVELTQQQRPNSLPQRSSSFLKKLVNFGEESKNLLKRSMSVRDVSKKRDREKLTDIKKQEWRQSLQSLVENDVHVSYKDLSFVNYDVLNNITYDKEGVAFRDHASKGHIARTQSLIEKRSPSFRRPVFYRGISTTSDNPTSDATCLAEQSGALSLPSLHHLHNQENAATSASGENINCGSSDVIGGSAIHRYRRRPQSISSEDGTGGGCRPRSQHHHHHAEGSFRSAGSGCSKLKRQNACRQKTRDSAPVLSAAADSTRQRTEQTLSEKYTIFNKIETISKKIRRCRNLVFPRDPPPSRPLTDKTLFNIVKLFASKPLKIARESLTIDKDSTQTSTSSEGHQEWRKFVGSIRRKVQRHASSSSSPDQATAGQATREPLSRKNSLTQHLLFKREKSIDENEPKKTNEPSGSSCGTKQPLIKQKSIGSSTTSAESGQQQQKSDIFKGLTLKDKSKSVSVKHVDSLAAPKMGEAVVKGVRKSDKTKDSSEKTLKSSLNFSSKISKHSASSGGGKHKVKEEKGLKQDDFLKATMRIFLVVSPPVGKLQVRSRSLNHLDTLEMRQGVVPTPDPALKDSRSEPDCTRPLLAPPSVTTPEPPTPTRETPPHAPARKHMLSRSQKSSSECFSVNFEVGDESTWDNELFFIAQRGITLHDSLSKMCELRNIDLSTCDARLQDKENNTETFLSFVQDTGSLVGRHIRITAKETTTTVVGSSNKKLSGSLYGNHTRKQSGSYRPRTSSFFSSSTEEASVAVANSTLSLHDGDQSKKQIKQRLTAFFGNSKDTKYEALIDQLDKYSKQGIPNNLSYPQGQCESVDALYRLEDDWREIVDFSDLNEKQQQQQTALWELITSEVSYIRTLKVVTDLFLACLKDLQTHNLLKEIDREKLFSNITEILDSNVIFWRNTLFPLIRDMRKRKRTTCIENMLEGFSTLHDTFQPYYKYCAEQARCQHYCRENMDSEVFTAYLTWCESQKECNRLRLMDILVQPMQRLTKYGLLLKAILRNTDEDVERESLQSMIKMVDDFVINVNSSLKHKQDNERLKGIIARIESYDIVESKDDDIDKILKKDRSFTQLDLNRPMLGCPAERKRHLLLEGDLKLKDSSTSKMEVHCFLLTDMLLICKPSTKKGAATMRVVRQPYLVDRLVVSELHRETPSLAVIYKNEFDMAVAAFILQNNDAKKLKGWKEGIIKAQSLYIQAKQTSFMPEDSMDVDYSLESNLESDYHSLQLAPRSPLATSSRASRVSSLAHSHSGSVEMNDQSSIGSAKDQSRGVSIENENRTGSISSDEGVQPLPVDNKSPVCSQKNSFKTRLFSKTPNTLSVQPFGSLGQSLPNLTLGSPNIGSLCLSLNQNTLSVPSSKNGSHLLSPTHRGISYPPPSPTRANLRRGLAISQSKNPPLIKTRHVNSTASTSQQVPASFDFDVPVIAGISQKEDQCESFSRGHHRQAMKRVYRNDKRYHTAGVVDDIKKNDSRDASIHKRLSWNCSSQEQRPPPNDEDHT